MIAIFADAHVAESPWAGRAIYGDSEYALWQVTRWAIRHQVSAVIGAGDLLDRQRNRSYPVSVWTSAIARLRRKRIPFYYVCGQHDQDQPPWFVHVPGAFHLHGRLVELEGCRWYGLDYQSSEALPAALAAIPAQADVLICHQAWSEWMHLAGSAQGSLALIPRVRLVFTGDYHHFLMQPHRGADGQTMTVVSPGSLCLQDITEPLPKQFVVWRADGTVQSVPIQSRIRLDWGLLETEQDVQRYVDSAERLLDEALEQARQIKLPEQLHKPLLVVEYRAGLDDRMAALLEIIQPRAHVFCKVRPRQITRTDDLQPSPDVSAVRLTDLIESCEELDAPLRQLVQNMVRQHYTRSQMVEAFRRYLQEQIQRLSQT